MMTCYGSAANRTVAGFCLYKSKLYATSGFCYTFIEKIYTISALVRKKVNYWLENANSQVDIAGVL